MKRISVETFLERHIGTAPPAGYIFHGQIFPSAVPAHNLRESLLRPYVFSSAQLACAGLAGICSYAAQIPEGGTRVVAGEYRPGVQSQAVPWDANLREQLVAACGMRSPLVQSVLYASDQATRGPDIWSVRPHYSSPATIIGITAYSGEQCLGVAVNEGDAIPEYALLFEAFWHGIYTRFATRVCAVPTQSTGSNNMYRPLMAARP